MTISSTGWQAALFILDKEPTTMDELKQSISRLTEYARTPKKRLLVVEQSIGSSSALPNCSATTTLIS